MEDLKPIILTLHDIDLILIDIVKRSRGNKCFRLNGYFRLRQAIDWNANNWNKNRIDYDKGYYYTRLYEDQGSVPGTECSQYQAMAMESTASNREDFKSRKGCHQFWINIADKIECQDCPDDCHRTAHEVEQDNLETLNNVITELGTYAMYTISYDSGKEERVWLSKGHYEYLMANLPADIESIKNNCGVELCHHISFDQLRFNTAKFAGVNNLIITNVQLTICGCYIDKGEYDYSPKSKKNLGITKCAYC